MLNSITAKALTFVQAVKEAGFVVSEKSAINSNDKKMAQKLQANLKEI